MKKILKSENMVENQKEVLDFSFTLTNLPYCLAEIITKIDYKSGLTNWLACGGICISGLCLLFPWFGCQFIPFCINDLKDVVHSCPNCKKELGIASRLS
ncbi:lipopolysaccharide-induced tumor necrosis factor-alpha factor [Brachionus plicatilis]|uniref:Lipopolysaccharide-induced tumor necrosis factor-alpha factor n=1 Tax=Brachionus plicatilis TaxID=10195 RepID=A0A3M7R2J4_BRAPC|nr:lipopolysaccharide-induced tumor necrosis factor-alpha factor [Brachionus plicatilis]